MSAALRYRLYEAAVQTPEHDVELLTRIFRARAGRAPLSLREDFCGTARLAAAWVGSDDEREAVAVDLDARVLRHAARHRRALEEDAERLTLIRGDARAPSPRTFDLVTAMNFSWALFDDPALAAYLASASGCLEDEGLLVLELFGGAGLGELGRREHRVEDDELAFTYVWEQRAFDAERRVLDAHIHFRLDDGRALESAFRYRFHLRALERLASLFVRAGLEAPTLHVEDARGRYRRAAREPRATLWRGLLMAGRARAGDALGARGSEARPGSRARSRA